MSQLKLLFWTLTQDMKEGHDIMKEGHDIMQQQHMAELNSLAMNIKQ